MVSTIMVWLKNSRSGEFSGIAADIILRVAQHFRQPRHSQFRHRDHLSRSGTAPLARDGSRVSAKIKAEAIPRMQVHSNPVAIIVDDIKKTPRKGLFRFLNLYRLENKIWNFFEVSDVSREQCRSGRKCGRRDNAVPDRQTAIAAKYACGF